MISKKILQRIMIGALCAVFAVGLVVEQIDAASRKGRAKPTTSSSSRTRSSYADRSVKKQAAVSRRRAKMRQRPVMHVKSLEDDHSPVEQTVASVETVKEAEIAEVKPANKLTAFQALVQDMKCHKSINVGFHSGHLYEHCMWVAQVIDRWFEENNEWVSGLDQEDRRLAVLSGFMHDVGKASNQNPACNYHHGTEGFFYTTQPHLASYPFFYNIPSHPRDGFDFMIKKTDYKLSTPRAISEKEVFGKKVSATIEKEDHMAGKAVNFDEIFDELNISENDRRAIAVLIGIHWSFGSPIVANFKKEGEKKPDGSFYTKQEADQQNDMNAQAFLTSLEGLVKEAGYNGGKVDRRIVLLSILIGASDVDGAQDQVGDFKAFKLRYPDLFGGSELAEQIFEEPKSNNQYPKGCVPRFEFFKFGTRGLEARTDLLEYFDTEYVKAQQAAENVTE